jgi:hypothetical protein
MAVSQAQLAVQEKLTTEFLALSKELYGEIPDITFYSMAELREELAELKREKAEKSN